jgi:hypothetical protein
LTFELFCTFGLVTAQLGSNRVEDGVGDASLESGDLVGEFRKGLH